MTRLVALLSVKRVCVALALALAVAAGAVVTDDVSHTTITASFSNTTGLYVGNDVRVLGVTVGEVTAIEPRGTESLVTLEVDGGQPIPADAKAAIVSPTLVSGRYVQLTPAYQSGERLEDGDRIELERTAIPVSFDDVKKQLTRLATALGPNARNENGSLNRAITVLDRNLSEGDGTQLRASISSLRSAADTLSNGRSDLFTTVKNLNEFARNLALTDEAVRGFTQKLTNVSGVLDRNRTELTSTLTGLRKALRSLRGFLGENRTVINQSVTKVNTLAGLLADRSDELAGTLHVAPTALDNLRSIIENQGITARASLANLDSVAQLVCGAVLGAGGTAKQCTTTLQPLLTLLGADDLLSTSENPEGPGSAPGGSTGPGGPGDLPQQLPDDPTGDAGGDEGSTNDSTGLLGSLLGGQ